MKCLTCVHFSSSPDTHDYGYDEDEDEDGIIGHAFKMECDFEVFTFYPYTRGLDELERMFSRIESCTRWEEIIVPPVPPKPIGNTKKDL